MDSYADGNFDGKLDIDTSQGFLFYNPAFTSYVDMEIMTYTNADGKRAIKAAIAARANGIVSSIRKRESGRVERNYLPSTLNSPGNVFVDVEFANNEEGYFLLSKEGVILGIDKSGNEYVYNTIRPQKSGNKKAVDMEVVKGDLADPVIYVLFANGTVSRINSKSGMAAPALTGAPFSEAPIYVDMEIIKENNQFVAGVVGTSPGQFFEVYPEGGKPQGVELPNFQFGANATMAAFELQNDPDFGLGLFAVTRIGTIHTFGSADRFLSTKTDPTSLFPPNSAENGGPFVVTITDPSTGNTIYQINPNINIPIVEDIEVYLIDQTE
ncbi:MAG: hypothetical protein GC154_04715 [bacterium]|nr:hypothetical protein [bacterium]